MELWDRKGQFAFRFASIGRYRSSRDLATAIVTFLEMHRPARVRIEDAIAARYLEGEILAVARELLKGKTYQLEGDFPMPPVWDEKKQEWIETPPTKTRLDFVLPDRVKDAKSKRILALQPAMESGTIVFAANMLVQHEELCKQFLRFDGKCKPRRKDDFLDAIASAFMHEPYQRHAMWSIAKAREIPDFAPDSPAVILQKRHDEQLADFAHEQSIADDIRSRLQQF